MSQSGRFRYVRKISQRTEEVQFGMNENRFELEMGTRLQMDGHVAILSRFSD